MAIYHLAVKSVSRSTGRSAVAAAAYRTGACLENERDGLVHDYTRRSGVEDTLMAVPEGAEWALDRSALWNAAEAAEKRKDAKVAREYELALPSELDADQRHDLVRAFAEDIRDRYGVAVDAAIHAPHDYGDDRNHHAHVMTTTRVVGADGLGAKTRQLDVRTTASIEVETIRERWAGMVNDALEHAHVAERVDHRSYERQGLDIEPTVKMTEAVASRSAPQEVDVEDEHFAELSPGQARDFYAGCGAKTRKALDVIADSGDRHFQVADVAKAIGVRANELAGVWGGLTRRLKTITGDADAYLIDWTKSEPVLDDEENYIDQTGEVTELTYRSFRKALGRS